MSRRRKRLGHSIFELYSADTCPGGPRFVRRCSVVDAERMVRQNKAIRIEQPETGECLGYQLLPDGVPVGRRSHIERECPARTSSSVLSKKEMEAAATGISDTEGMTQQQREARFARRLPTYDFVEQSRAKLNAFKPVRSGSK